MICEWTEYDNSAWTESGDDYLSGCKQVFDDIQGDFCPGCGGKITFKTIDPFEKLKQEIKTMKGFSL